MSDEHQMEGDRPAEAIEEPTAVESQPEQAPDGLSRRDALRKAAVGAGAAAAVWVAPRVDGLSLRPDYAAAGTANKGVNFGPFTKNNPLGGNANFNIPTPTGNEFITATYNGDSTNGNINVSFNNMDPPFNSTCRISAASGSAPGGVGNVRTSINSNTSISWDIYNPFWGNTNLANANSLTFSVIC